MITSVALAGTGLILRGRCASKLFTDPVMTLSGFLQAVTHICRVCQFGTDNVWTLVGVETFNDRKEAIQQVNEAFHEQLGQVIGGDVWLLNHDGENAELELKPHNCGDFNGPLVPSHR